MFGNMKIVKRGIVAATVVAMGSLSVGTANAWIGDTGNPDKDLAKEEKALLKLQKDAYKQGVKYIDCVVKATNKCSYKYETESSTDESCALATYDDAMYAGFNPKFVAAVNKCADKQDYTKKQPKTLSSAESYLRLNCPGDADSSTSGVDEDFADLESWQAGDGLRANLSTIDALGIIVRLVTPDRKQAYKDVGTLGKYASGAGKCIEKCEYDQKDKKGNGGTTDSLTQCFPGDGGMDANMAACYQKNFEKMEKKLGAGGGDYAAIIPQIDAAYGAAANATWNSTACSGVTPSPSGAFLDGASNF